MVAAAAARSSGKAAAAAAGSGVRSSRGPPIRMGRMCRIVAQSRYLRSRERTYQPNPTESPQTSGRPGLRLPTCDTASDACPSSDASRRAPSGRHIANRPRSERPSIPIWPRSDHRFSCRGRSSARCSSMASNSFPRGRCHGPSRRRRRRRTSRRRQSARVGQRRPSHQPPSRPLLHPAAVPASAPPEPAAVSLPALVSRRRPAGPSPDLLDPDRPGEPHVAGGAARVQADRDHDRRRRGRGIRSEAGERRVRRHAGPGATVG